MTTVMNIGYQNVEFYADEKDFLILISSSGQSLNIINAAIEAKKRDITIATFTGFTKSNQLSKIQIYLFGLIVKHII